MTYICINIGINTMVDVKETFPHLVLIAKAEIKKKDFSEDLREHIASFERRFNTWKGQQQKRYEAGDPLAVKSHKALVSESTILAQHIYDYFVEEDDQTNSTNINVVADQIKDAIQNPEPEPAKTPEPTTTPTPKVEPVAEPVSEPKTEPTPEPKATESTPASEPESDSDDEKALDKLFKAGTLTGISKDMLRREGFDVGFWSDLTSTGCKCGKYQLFKASKEEFYNLKKV
jgi:outer membrane biosynthesis protein TonB